MNKLLLKAMKSFNIFELAEVSKQGEDHCNAIMHNMKRSGLNARKGFIKEVLK